MKTYNIHQAKTHLSRLLEQVMAGEEVVIAKAGAPVAKLVALDETSKARNPGRLRGRLRVSDDFDAPLPEAIQRAFSGE